ncbi:MAG: hypothetical protein H6582_04750 [Crocinitomicaceae bacterium]|nr:hypothetical protein [Crocinitomicaceae bacterium]
MKRFFAYLSIGLLLASCGGYTEDQEKAANEFCDCMEKDQFGDFDINFYECDVQVMEKYKPETFADEGWSLALEEKCPDIAGQISDAE